MKYYPSLTDSPIPHSTNSIASEPPLSSLSDNSEVKTNFRNNPKNNINLQFSILTELLCIFSRQNCEICHMTYGSARGHLDRLDLLYSAEVKETEGAVNTAERQRDREMICSNADLVFILQSVRMLLASQVATYISCQCIYIYISLSIYIHIY